MADDSLDLGHPLTGRPDRVAGGGDEGGEGNLRVGGDANLRVRGEVSAQLGGVDVDVDDVGLTARKGPAVRALAARARSHDEREVGVGDDLVGGLAGVGAEHADGEGVVLVDGALPGEGGGNGNGELLGELDELGPGPGGHNATARDDDGAFGLEQERQRLVDTLGGGLGADGGAGGVAGVADRLGEVGLAGLGFGGDGEVDGAGVAGGGLAEGLGDEVGEALGAGHVGAELGDALEVGAHVLVGVLVGLRARTGSGEGDDGRRGLPGLGEAGGEVGRAGTALADDDAGAAGGLRVAVGHVAGCLLAVGEDATHAGPLEHDEGVEEVGGHEENGFDAVGKPALRDVLGALHDDTPARVELARASLHRPGGRQTSTPRSRRAFRSLSSVSIRA